MGFKVVFNSGGGVFILGNVAFVRGFGVVAFVNFLHVGGGERLSVRVCSSRQRTMSIGCYH